MAANQIPVFTLAPNVGAVAFSTANTNRDGTGTLGTLLTAGLNGTRFDRITIVAPGTTTPGMVRVFYDSGAAKFLIAEIPVPAITPSGNVPGFSYELVFSAPRVIPNGSSLKVSTHNGETFHAICPAGDY